MNKSTSPLKSYPSPIELPYLFKEQIATEFDCHVQTVRMALIWYNNSQLAEKIRSRAKELLLEEAKKISIHT